MTDALTVTQLTRKLKHTLEESYVDVWVEGEVSNFVHHSSGHMYFSIKDEQAQLSVVMFRSQNRSLTFTIENGLHVIINGSVTVYEKRGSYQIVAEVVEPKGVGALQLAFEQLKKKLQKEGLFDDEHKKRLPQFPQVIGVVTSPTGAAIRDILQIIDRRFSNVQVVINPVKVQGDGAAIEIARAIDEFNEYGKPDVLIIGRGGGSLEDLWAFNEEVVARAIYRSKIPIISAVGHEIDFTISDFVADLRAPTPSAAAELVVTKKSDWQNRIDDALEALQNSMRGYIDSYRERLSIILERYAFRHPMNMLKQYTQQLDEIMRRINNYMTMIVQEKKSIFQSIIGTLEALSPLAVLARGYSITYDATQKHALTCAREAKKGDTIHTKLHNGLIVSQVTTITQQND